jgi:hypothetical protein
VQGFDLYPGRSRALKRPAFSSIAAASAGRYLVKAKVVLAPRTTPIAVPIAKTARMPKRREALAASFEAGAFLLLPTCTPSVKRSDYCKCKNCCKRQDSDTRAVDTQGKGRPIRGAPADELAGRSRRASDTSQHRRARAHQPRRSAWTTSPFAAAMSTAPCLRPEFSGTEDSSPGTRGSIVVGDDTDSDRDREARAGEAPRGHWTSSDRRDSTR